MQYTLHILVMLVIWVLVWPMIALHLQYDPDEKIHQLLEIHDLTAQSFPHNGGDRTLGVADQVLQEG